jgi:hypothetical protein
MYDPDLRAIVNGAFLRLHEDAKAAGTFLGGCITNWIQSVYKTERPDDAFTTPDAFPLFLLPWYAETSLKPEPNKPLQSDLVYSTLNGYYYIRFIDNLMDGHGMEDLRILPVLSFFSTNFQNPYIRYFENGHPFWTYFNNIWLRSAEVSILDARIDEINEDLFKEVSSKKTCAVKIPVAAVFFHNECPDRIEMWQGFIDLFGCWHQMLDDIRDFPRDERDGIRTYFLSEAHRRKGSDELVLDWVIREGFDWGMKIIDSWMAEMEGLANELNSPKLKDYINDRKAIIFEQKSDMGRELKQMDELFTSLKGKLEKFESK